MTWKMMLNKQMLLGFLAVTKASSKPVKIYSSSLLIISINNNKLRFVAWSVFVMYFTF